MSQNRQYFIRVAGERVPVTEDVYREYYRMDRRERYLDERDAGHGKVLYNAMDTNKTLGVEAMHDAESKSVEQTVIDILVSEELHRCLNLLPDTERELIDALFFGGMTEREFSAVSGIPQQTIHSRKMRIIAKLKKFFKS
jgi:RNA polymerase sigma factor (sigma-70 family)